ncbi:MAG: hypothetical protein EXQ56_08945 [Acidobacteria bacterium]|nr:hypothetical protein [Acidobacteriota bacterium]
MQVHFAYHHVVRTAQIDKTIALNTEKLNKYLKHFEPDLVHLHGVLEYNSAKDIPTCSLNLSLPSAVLHAKETDDSILSALQECFKDLLRQVNKHKASLRREATWHRHPPLKVRAKTKSTPRS